jgi:hypothetical protein
MDLVFVQYLKASPLPPAPLEVKWLRRSEDQQIRSCCHLGLSWGHLVSSWAVLGPSWAMLGCLGAILGLSWEHLWPSLGHIGPSWGHVAHLGAILGYLGVNLAILGCHLSGFEGCPTRFGGFWGSTWPSWGAILADLEDLPRVLGGSGRFLRDVSHGLGFLWA